MVEVSEQQSRLYPDHQGELPVYRFKALQGMPVRHAIFTRHGGVSASPFDTLNVSWAVGDNAAAVIENVRRVYDAFGTRPTASVRVRMNHGTRVVAVDDRHANARVPNCDGLVTATPALPLTMTYGDCQPILLYDPVQHALALGHAGWRGAVAGLALSLVQALHIAYGTSPDNVIAMLGPAIGRCCYEVGSDVIAAVETWPDGRAWLTPGDRDGHALFDLSAANVAHVHRAGVGTIEVAHLCTACRTDEFYSYRAEKPATGRFAVVAMLEPLLFR